MKKKIKNIYCILIALSIVFSMNCESVSGFTISENSVARTSVHDTNLMSKSDDSDIDYDYLTETLIQNGIKYLQGQSKVKYGDEWIVFTLLRGGGAIEKADKEKYIENVWEKLNLEADKEKQKKSSFKTTDYARLVLTLTQMGVDASDFYGYNLIEKLYNFKNLNSSPSNYIAWSLIAIDSYNYEIPKTAKWQREDMVDLLLDYQCDNGSFGLINSKNGSLDMTAMIVQALAPYRDYEKVSDSIDKAINWLKTQMQSDCGFVAEGDENSCTTAQIIVALSALGENPIDPQTGFATGNDSIIHNITQFVCEDGGFSLYPGGRKNYMSTYQVTYSLIAFDRLRNGENYLYDLSDITIEKASVLFGKKTRKSQKITTNISSKKYKKTTLKKNKTFQIKAKASGKGTLTYASSKTKYVTVSKSGKVTVKKNIKKGTYYITVTAAGTGTYKSCSKKIKITVK